jgi:hypothetical protein
VALLAIVVATIGVYTHFVLRKVDYNLLVGTAVAIVAVLLFIWMRINYLGWKKSAI